MGAEIEPQGAFMAAVAVHAYHRPMNRTPSFTPLTAPLHDPLPPIVQRYLRMALPSGIPAVTKVTLTQRGAAAERGVAALAPLQRHGGVRAQSAGVRLAGAHAYGAIGNRPRQG
jgi:hypothetical protein